MKLETISNPEATVGASYEWTARLIQIACMALGNGLDVDLGPIRPAIEDLCEVLKALPRQEAAVWLKKLVILQEQMARLAADLANGALPKPPEHS